MNFRKRKGTTKSALPVEQFHKVKAAFLQEIIDTVMMEDIPSELIFNWDQTGLGSLLVMDSGSKCVEIMSVNDKQQITGLVCAMLDGELLSFQLIYKEKMKRCLPQYPFPLTPTTTGQMRIL